MIKTIFRTFLLGFGVGVLVAPRPGSETRQMLSERFGRLFGGENGSTDSAAEWERPLNDVGADVVPNRHYAESTTGTPSTFADVGTGTGSVNTTLADTDIGGAANI